MFWDRGGRMGFGGRWGAKVREREARYKGKWKMPQAAVPASAAAGDPG